MLHMVIASSIINAPRTRFPEDMVHDICEKLVLQEPLGKCWSSEENEGRCNMNGFRFRIAKGTAEREALDMLQEIMGSLNLLAHARTRRQDIYTNSFLRILRKDSAADGLFQGNGAQVKATDC